jgi:tetratricopeptide (TPR) repeat protein
MTFDQLLASMPISSVDSLAGICKVSMLKHSWPFNEALHSDTIIVNSKEGKLAWQLALKKITWQGAMDSLYSHYVTTNQLVKAEKIVEAMVLEHPTDEAYYERAAVLNGRIGNKGKAIMYFEHAFDLIPTFEKARYLFVLYLGLDKPFEALPYINYGINNNKTTFDLERLKDQVEEIVRMKEALKSDSMNVKVINHIANVYVKMDNLEGASKYVKKVLHIDARNKEALSLSSDINRKLNL